MEPSPHPHPAWPTATPAATRAAAVAYWLATAAFCLQMGFTAYAQLRLPQVAQAFTHLGFPTTSAWSCRGPRSPGWSCCSRRCPPASRWAYAGFAIDLGSALVAHLAVGDPPAACGDGRPAPSFSWALSYVFWRRQSR
ncbi:MAG: DoxX family protein [Vicinamibacteria bacterium]